MRSKRNQRGFIQWAIPAAAAVLGYMGTKDTNDTNMELGQKQMDFQERMSATAYQRATADMQQAGLNPMLAYSQGGASTPVGSMPQVQNAIGQATSSAGQAMQMMQAKQQIEQAEAATDKMRAEAEKIRSETYSPAFNQSARQAQLDYTRDRSNLTLQQATTELKRYGLVLSQTELNTVMQNLQGVRLDKENTTFSDDVKLRKAERVLREMDIPRAKADADFFGGAIGSNNPIIRLLIDLARNFATITRR